MCESHTSHEAKSHVDAATVAVRAALEELERALKVFLCFGQVAQRRVRVPNVLTQRRRRADNLLLLEKELERLPDSDHVGQAWSARGPHRPTAGEH